VVTAQRGTYVFVVGADETVRQQAVTVQRTVDSLAVIADGLTPGSLVVTDGQLRLTPDAHVEIRGGLPTEDSTRAAP
jgi:multidrug efflux system membrane fusion protein